jgi:hypothetical protein
VDELAGHVRFIHRKEEFRNLPTTRYGMPANESFMSIAPADVIGPTQKMWEAMLNGRDYTDGEAGKHALSALVAANLSSERGGAVINLQDPELPRQRIFQWA